MLCAFCALYFSVLSLVLVLIEKMSQIRGTVFHHIKNTSKLYKNIYLLRAIFATLFWAFGNVVRRGISCLILFLCKIAHDQFCQYTLAENFRALFKDSLFFV